MKTTIENVLNLVILILSLMIISCSKDDQGVSSMSETISFSFRIQGVSTGRQDLDVIPQKVRITIEDMDGEVVSSEGMILELFPFGEGYVSEGLTLDQGNYMLTLFQVLGQEDQVIYASPIEGSEKASLVDNPLPLEFSVSSDETTTVTPEVLVVLEGDNPSEFGYVDFGFEVVETFDFSFAVISDWDSTLQASTIYVVERDSSYNELDWYTVNYSGGGFETLELRADVPVTEIQVVGPSGFHTASFVSYTDQMKNQTTEVTNLPYQPYSEGGALFFISRKEKTVKYFVPLPPYNYQSYLFLYVSQDPCEHAFRADFGGWKFDETVSLNLGHYILDEPLPASPGSGWAFGISGSPASWGWRVDLAEEENPFMQNGPFGNYLMTGFMESSFDVCEYFGEDYYRVENVLSLLNYHTGESIVDVVLEFQRNSDEGWWSSWCNECGTIFYQIGDDGDSGRKLVGVTDEFDLNFRNH